ncbi:MAG TPA: cation diffusion facilitator family transporter [Solirubrobacterales bacterium]|nr:cation diffusion facilitator family transporter [Solirubrobacterales bacterium]
MSDAARATRLKRLMLLAVAAAALTIAIKVVAWQLTDSVSLFSDAAESGVNLVAALFGLAAVMWASRPADEDHAYGHEKANYLSAGVEGALILLAAFAILYAAVGRLLNPIELESIGVGVAVVIGASVINLVVGRLLIAQGREHGSLTLDADGRHLITDVWTTAGVVIGLGLVAVTGWQALDPIVAIAVAINIVRVGAGLVRDSAGGLMDRALESGELATVEAVLAAYRGETVQFHALRTRRSGRRAFITMHVLVPGAWSVQDGHDLAERIEADLRQRFDQATVFTHLEPMEDPASFRDTRLDRDRDE